MRLNKIITTALLACAVMAAAEAAGTVSAAKGLQLNGQAVPVAGTKQWPVSAGDELKSDAAPVVLTMKDGSRMVLGKHSAAKVEAGTVRLVAGTMQYELAQGSTLRVAVKGEVLQSRTGVASTVASAAAPAVPVVPVALTPATEDLPPVSRRKP